MNNRYKEITNWLFNQVPMFQNVGAGVYKPGLDTVLRLSEVFGSPHLHLKAIHIAGTNGKGSTASSIAAILTSAGYKTALYTSPHLVDFRERIRIDGAMISEEKVVDFIERFRNLNFKPQPSFFELTTVMAFEHFARDNVDYAVVEVGLGGRLDATNIITPEISVITNISFDHTSLLGNTLAEIATEKAGIIKAGIPVIIGHSNAETRDVFINKAAAESSPIVFASEHKLYSSLERYTDHITYRNTPWGDIESELIGDCQPENANTVFNALSVLVPTLKSEAVAEGFAQVGRLSGLIGRWTTLNRAPLTICDTGHNPGGWQYIAPRLSQIASASRLHIVIGFVNDKDISAILSALPKDARYYFASPSVKRGYSATLLKDDANTYALQGEAYDTVAKAYTAAQMAASPLDTIFIGGSTFVVADLLIHLQNS